MRRFILNAALGGLLVALLIGSGVPGTASAQTAQPTATPSGIGTDVYRDDRSSADAVILSFYNAINRHEYVRAYSYWALGDGPTPEGLAPFDRFAPGYAKTASVAVTLGVIGSDVGAGQIYFTVPAALVATMTDGTVQTFVGCFSLHLGQPSFQGAPPFVPLQITAANVVPVAGDANIPDRLSGICAVAGIRQTSPLPTDETTPDPTVIDTSRYIDDRSDAVAVLRSLFNAINRHEYVRAYSYWESTAPELAPFPQFQTGYTNTDSVQLVTGTVSDDAGAGQLHYSVPVVLTAKQMDGTLQTFAGCYQLHLSQPAIQAVLPFRPLAITAAKVQKVANGASPSSLLPTACVP